MFFCVKCTGDYMENTEKYVNEMYEMQKKAKKAEEKTGGSLQVFVTTLNGVYPVKGAKVRIFTKENEEEKTLAEDYTDQSGKTKIFSLPAPGVSFSLDKESQTVPYSLYNVSVAADGFVSQTLMNLPIFSGVTSLQRVNMLPFFAANGKKTEITDEMPDYNL